MIPGSANPLLLASAAAAGAYQVERSLRFNSSDSAYLSRTPAVAGNRRTFTFSTWVKRSKLSSGFQQLICSYDGSTGSTYFSLIFTPSDTIRVEDISVIYRETTQVFRDASAWYCIQLAVDTTQATAANRIKLYVNGSEVTTFATTNNPTQNTDFGINNTVAHAIGRSGAQSAYYQDGYLAECYLIDGQALTPSSFTEVSATTGQLIPQAYTGTYGTNGFQLKFADNSSNTAATLGKDTSGNSNNWTPNNLSVTAGAGNDSLVDTPTSFGTDTGVGGEVRGNYATLNPLSKASVATLSNGNLDASFSGSSYPHLGSDATIALPSSGKWYWEITVTTVGELWTGIRNVVDGKQSTYYRDGSGGFNNIRIEASSSPGSANAASYTSGDIIGVAVNCDGSTIAWYKNGSQVGTTYSLTNVANLVPFAGNATTVGSAAVVANFGQRAFAYTAPSGFKALCDTNLGAPLVAKPNTVMDVALYTGNGSTQTISGLGFSPDFVWLRNRSQASNWVQFDTVRGVLNRLCSNLTVAEASLANSLTSFDSTGFTYGSEGSGNNNGDAFAAFCWDAGTTTASNGSGSITSQVRANVSAGFSVVTFTSPTGTGNFSAGHGLGVTPEFVIVKSRDAVGVWYVYHKSLATDHYLRLNGTNASGTDGVQWGAGMTSSVLGLRASYSTVSGATTVAYAFAPVVGYSSFGSYVGNGTNDGPFVYTGFRPRWMMVKSTGSGAWIMHDTSRNPYNASVMELQANDSTAEYNTNTFSAGDRFDILSNGFKSRTSNSYNNSSAQAYIYMAFAENPFQYARAR